MSRIAAAAALVVLTAAGCGGGAPPPKLHVHGVPSALAQNWERQASAIATAATARNDCRAQALALSLRTQVMQKEHLLPLRLRSPLVTGLDSLVSRTTCTKTVVETTTPAPPPHGPKPHDHGHHGPGGDHGGNQGGDG